MNLRIIVKYDYFKDKLFTVFNMQVYPIYKCMIFCLNVYLYDM